MGFEVLVQKMFEDFRMIFRFFLMNRYLNNGKMEIIGFGDC